MTKKENIKLLFVGDTYVNEIFFEPGKSLKKIIQEHDFVCCNFEGPLFGSKQEPITKVGPHLSQNKKTVDFLLSQGFNLFSISNNHIMDYGKESLKKTIEAFPGESYIGAGLSTEEAYKPIIKNFNNQKIGFLSFSEWQFGSLDDEGNYGYAWINHKCVNKLIENTKARVDFLIIQVHAGVEEIDLPLPEWRERYKELINLGADIIIGHHPHVPQGWEKYKGKYIFYSLGNFYMDHPNREYDKSFILSLFLEKDLTLNFDIIPTTKEKNKLNLSEIKKDIYDLTHKLNSDNYIAEINKACIKLWNDRYKKYYYSALKSAAVNMGLLFNMKMIKKMFLNRDINKAMLLHNLKIESHRFCVERYLSLKKENEI